MINIERTKRFEQERKKFVKHHKIRAENIIKALSHIIKDPQHPSLNVEKLKGSNVWTLRIDKGNRIFFLWINSNTILLVDIGPHDKYRNYLFQRQNSSDFL